MVQTHRPHPQGVARRRGTHSPTQLVFGVDIPQCEAILTNKSMSRVRKYKQTTFALPPELLAAALELTKRTRIPTAAFVREGLAIVVKKYASLLGDQMPPNIDEFLGPANANAYNALAWKEPHRAPTIAAPLDVDRPDCAACGDTGRSPCPDPSMPNSWSYCSCTMGVSLKGCEAK